MALEKIEKQDLKHFFSYDDASDELVLDLSDVAEHTIAGPQEVWVDQDDEGLKSIEVQCKEGHRHIIKFK